MKSDEIRTAKRWLQNKERLKKRQMSGSSGTYGLMEILDKFGKHILIENDQLK